MRRAGKGSQDRRIRRHSGISLCISTLIVSWLFLGFPQIFHFPPVLQEAQAADIIGSWTAGLSHTAEPGTNRALIFTAHAESSTAGTDLASVTYGGQAMTKIVDAEYFVSYYDDMTAMSPNYWWRLDGNENDSAGAANSDGGVDPAWVSSIIPVLSGTNQCGDYNGTSSETLIPNQSDINASITYEKSISVWIEADTIDTSGNGRVIWGEGGPTNGLALYVLDVGGEDRLYLTVYEGGSTGSFDYIYTTISTGTVYHIGAVLDCSATGGGEMFLYVNGSLAASKTGGLNIGTDLAAHAAGVAIGGVDFNVLNHDGSAMSGYFDGRIADVVYWAEQSVLGQSDFASIYSAGTNEYTAAFILDEAGIAAATSSDFVVTWGTAPDGTPDFASVFVSGVDQTNPIGQTGTGGSETTTAETSPLSTNDGDMAWLRVRVVTLARTRPSMALLQPSNWHLRLLTVSADT